MSKTATKNKTAESLKEISQVQRDIYLDLFKKIKEESKRKIRNFNVSFGRDILGIEGIVCIESIGVSFEESV